MKKRGGLKILVFVVITGMLTAMVAVVIGEIRFQDTQRYNAMFSEISGLGPGDEVRVAGVTVGQVEDVELQPDNTVRSSFDVASVSLTRGTQATIRYKNLTGDRYLDLTNGPGSTEVLEPEGTIPMSQTTPALDLDALFNGFKPLMRGLSPNDLNKLTSSLISVFQGQSGNISMLLQTISSLTNTLADRDKVIGSLIDNMNGVLSTLDERRSEFSDLIVNLQQVISGLSSDREVIGNSATDIADLAGNVTNYVDRLRPEFKGATRQLSRVSSQLNTMPKYIGYNLSLIPRVIQLTGRGGSYGSFFNLYLCSVRFRLDGPNGPIYTPMLRPEVPRCKYPDGKVFH